MRQPAEERDNSATRVGCHTPIAERQADHSQVVDPGEAGYGLSAHIWRKPSASRIRRPPLYLNEYVVYALMFLAVPARLWKRQMDAVLAASFAQCK